MIGDLFAPEGGWVVRIRDHSAETEDEAIEDVRGFESLMHANAFARAYVRDSIERCRVPDATPEEVLGDWHAFGWSSSSELAFFARTPAPSGSIERDWRGLDPRRNETDEDDDDE
jgi:hypothetical protein